MYHLHVTAFVDSLSSSFRDAIGAPVQTDMTRHCLGWTVRGKEYAVTAVSARMKEASLGLSLSSLGKYRFGKQSSGSGSGARAVLRVR